LVNADADGVGDLSVSALSQYVPSFNGDSVITSRTRHIGDEGKVTVR
jgi:hypothetical protein